MKTIAAFVFPGFETLDYFGPIEMLGGFAGQSKIITVAQTLDPVASVHGQRIVPDATLDQKDDYDLILIPGGDAALNLLQDQPLLDWINRASTNAEKVMAVCTGTILLGASGVLDGRRATTNKMDFTANVPLVPNVTWVKQARWVQDGKFYTSSGVSAGMADLYGDDTATKLAISCEYEWHKDPDRDPFAKLAGLV